YAPPAPSLFHRWPFVRRRATIGLILRAFAGGALPLDGGDRDQVFLEGPREPVSARGIGDEVEEVGLRGRDRGLERGQSGVADRPRRQPVVHVGVVGGVVVVVGP